MERNYVKEAIFKLGGPTVVGNTLKVSTNTIHNWMRQGRIPRLIMAKSIATASGYQLDQLWKFRPQKLFR